MKIFLNALVSVSITLAAAGFAQAGELGPGLDPRGIVVTDQTGDGDLGPAPDPWG